MASTFTWLDYSEHERRKMLDAIESFGEKTTRDELGLGSVRDASRRNLSARLLPAALFAPRWRCTSIPVHSQK
jgi:hypothetical protein